MDPRTETQLGHSDSDMEEEEQEEEQEEEAAIAATPQSTQSTQSRRVAWTNKGKLTLLNTLLQEVAIGARAASKFKADT